MLGVTLLRTRSAISFFPSDNFFIFLESERGYHVQYFYVIKNIGHRACLRGKDDRTC